MTGKRFGPWLLTALIAAGAHQAIGVGRASQGATAVIDVEKLGPKVGDRVPDFSLPDQHGTIRTLNSMIGPKGAVLVFFRSADW